MSGVVVKKWSGGGQEGLHFWCPGCQEAHTIRTAPDGWGWNGDLEKPTFTPSVKVAGRRRITDAEHARIMAGETIETEPTCCHSFVTHGRILFLSDCTHSLAGQTVDLPPWNDAET